MTHSQSFAILSEMGTLKYELNWLVTLLLRHCYRAEGLGFESKVVQVGHSVSRTARHLCDVSSESRGDGLYHSLHASA